MIGEKQYLEIKAQIEYQENEKPSVLFEKLNRSQISLEKKVEFVLQRYGWSSNRRRVSVELEKAHKAQYPFFPAGEQFIEHFDGLAFP